MLAAAALIDLPRALPLAGAPLRRRPHRGRRRPPPAHQPRRLRARLRQGPGAQGEPAEDAHHLPLRRLRHHGVHRQRGVARRRRSAATRGSPCRSSASRRTRRAWPCRWRSSTTCRPGRPPWPSASRRSASPARRSATRSCSAGTRCCVRSERLAQIAPKYFGKQAPDTGAIPGIFDYVGSYLRERAAGKSPLGHQDRLREPLLPVGRHGPPAARQAPQRAVRCSTRT